MLHETDKYYLITEYNDLETAFTKNDKVSIIKKVYFDSPLLISGFSDLTKTQFEYCIFEGDLTISQTFSACFFSDCEFRGNLTFENCESTHILEISNCVFKKQLVFNEFKTWKYVMHYNRQISIIPEMFITINQSSFGVCSFGKNEFFNNITLPAAVARDFTLSQGQTGSDISIVGAIKEDKPDRVFNIKLLFDFKGKTNFAISNIKIMNLMLEGENKDSTLILKDLIVDFVSIKDFSNYGIIKVYAIDVQHAYCYGEIHAINSNLGKTELYNIDFAKFRKVRLRHVNVTEIVPVNVVWCDYVKNIEYMLKDGDNFAEYKDTYRQLKSVMNKQHDKAQELAFQRNEMTMYWYHLKKNRGLKFSEYLILWSSKFSNDFGQSWLKPLGILLFLNLFLYAIVSALLPCEFTFFQSVANLLEFINPVHDFRSLFEIRDGRASGLARTIDGLARIINSYLIFQLISAFRKFVK